MTSPRANGNRKACGEKEMKNRCGNVLRRDTYVLYKYIALPACTIYGSQEVYTRLAPVRVSPSPSSFTSSRRGRANLTFVFRRKVPPSPPQVDPSARSPEPRGIRRDNNVGGWGAAAKCLTRCSKLHLIQRPRLAKWHIVRGASINGSPLPRRGGGGVPFSANKNTFRTRAICASSLLAAHCR